MRNLRLIVFILVALAQLAVPASIVWTRGQTLAYGRVWKFKTEPVDPDRCDFAGATLLLRFAAEKAKAITTSRNYSRVIRSGESSLSTLKEDSEDGFAQVDQVSTERITGSDNVIRGRKRVLVRRLATRPIPLR